MAPNKVKGPHLIIHKGNLTGRIHAIDRRIITIGRDQTNDIIIADIAVSRFHARLICKNQGTLEFAIEDMNSTNGTSINGKSITGIVPVKFGDEILLAHDVYVLLKNGSLYSDVNFSELSDDTVPAPLIIKNTAPLTHEVNADFISAEERRAYQDALLNDADSEALNRAPTSTGINNNQLPHAPYVFISYSSKDKAIMERIVNSLSQAGIAVWVDEMRLKLGERSWRRAVQEGIDKCACVLVIMSPNAKNSEWVERELSYAEMQNKRIYCVLAQGDEGSSILLGFTASQWVDMRQDYDAAMQKTTQSIRDYITSKTTSD